MARQISANDHFYLERFALVAQGDGRIRNGDLPVGKDVGRSVQELGGNQIQYLALVGYARGQDYVEGADTVGYDHGQKIISDLIDITHFSDILSTLARQREVGTNYRFHFFWKSKHEVTTFP